jgi:thiosulfate dehydrogenase (quinone) large subunit
MEALEWMVVLRVALGLWWLESFRHKDFGGWWHKASGISWAASVAEKHPLPAVRRGFQATVAKRPLFYARVVVLAELALGLGLVAGFLTPIALAGSAVLCTLYLILMIKDWAEQGQNLMMIAIAVACIGARAWEIWSIDELLGLFQR